MTRQKNLSTNFLDYVKHRCFPPAQTSSPLDADKLDDSSSNDDVTTFPIIGVGASAGGLEAFSQLLRELPVDTGMAFVLVQHLAPTHASALAVILGRVTKIPVAEACDETRIEKNHIYVIPPDRNMIVFRGVLRLMKRESHGVHYPIDQFFRSLAQEQKHKAVGVVLSGFPYAIAHASVRIGHLP